MVLTINGGSSSLKFAAFSVNSPPQRLVWGKIDRIGEEATRLSATWDSGRQESKALAAPNHRACVPSLMEVIGDGAVIAVAHRIVHGGSRYFDPACIDRPMIDYLRTLSDFVPEHLPAEIELIEALSERYPDVPHVACFDTGFHKDIPRLAQMLPIPREYERHGVRRYGFHGLSYSWLMEELERLAGEQAANGRVILAHLGNGCSMAAVRGGHCVDTTMSFTPAAGMVMGRRSGDLDPGLVGYLARVEGMTPEDFNRMVNTKSGLLGVSETTSDVRDLLELERKDSRAAEALGLFCYQARKWIGALAAAAGGLDTLVFSGGIGENAPKIRERICAGLEFLGVHLDPEHNSAGSGVISDASTPVTVRVIRTNEELYMAECALKLIRRNV